MSLARRERSNSQFFQFGDHIADLCTIVLNSIHRETPKCLRDAVYIFHQSSACRNLGITTLNALATNGLFDWATWQGIREVVKNPPHPPRAVEVGFDSILHVEARQTALMVPLFPTTIPIQLIPSDPTKSVRMEWDPDVVMHFTNMAVRFLNEDKVRLLVLQIDMEPVIPVITLPDVEEVDEEDEEELVRKMEVKVEVEVKEVEVVPPPKKGRARFTGIRKFTRLAQFVSSVSSSLSSKDKGKQVEQATLAVKC